jgi:hypothetical protein
VFVGRLEVPLLRLPETTAVAAPGRVHGLGRFEHPQVLTALRDAMPTTLRDRLRREFEWYACRGARFHNDAHYADVLFGAWCAAGPPREVVFARSGLRVPAAPGDWVVFDPFEPHGVLDPGARQYRREQYEGAPVSLFIGFELELDEHARSAFGIGPVQPGAPLLSSGVAIHAETGALN